MEIIIIPISGDNDKNRIYEDCWLEELINPYSGICILCRWSIVQEMCVCVELDSYESFRKSATSELVWF